MNTCKFKMPLYSLVRSSHQKILHFYFPPLCCLSPSPHLFVLRVRFHLFVRRFSPSHLFEFQIVTLFFLLLLLVLLFACPVICVYIAAQLSNFKQ